jgi:dihydrofolate reductase
MGKLTVIENVTLDGVMQAPGAPDEDTRGGFAHGGWAAPYSGDAMNRVLARDGGRPTAMLLGRHTYVRFASFWPQQPPNPFTEILSRQTKYVASATLRDPLPWENSVLLEGDAAVAVQDLKAREPADIVVLGSGALVRSLAGHGLVDEYILLFHPLVLGSGTRLFDDTVPRTPLELVASEPTTTGVVIATYRPSVPPVR